MKKIYCENEEKDIYYDEPCRYQQGRVLDPTKTCIGCYHLKALQEKSKPIIEPRHSKKSSEKQRKRSATKNQNRWKKELSELMKANAPYPRSHLLEWHEGSGIDIMFPRNDPPGSFYPWPIERVFQEEKSPFRLIDAIDDGNRLMLRINLDFIKDPMKEVLEKLLSFGDDELDKHGRKRFKFPGRQYEQIVKAWKLRKKKQTDRQMADKMFPHDIGRDSARKKARRFSEEAKKLIEGK